MVQPDQPELDLQVIRRLMEGATETAGENSNHLVLWGLVLGFAELFAYGADRGLHPASSGVVWFIAIALGWFLSVRMSRSEQKTAPVNSFVTRILAAIWVGCGIGMTLLGFLGSGTGSLPGSVAPGVMAVVIGTAFFASSFVPKLKVFRVLAVSWWSLGGFMLAFPAERNALIMSAALILLMAVPGYLFGRRRTTIHQLSVLA